MATNPTPVLGDASEGEATARLSVTVHVAGLPIVFESFDAGGMWTARHDLAKWGTADVVGPAIRYESDLCRTLATERAETARLREELEALQQANVSLGIRTVEAIEEAAALRQRVAELEGDIQKHINLAENGNV